jgi:hypothetical protein
MVHHPQDHRLEGWAVEVEEVAAEEVQVRDMDQSWFLGTWQ